MPRQASWDRKHVSFVSVQKQVLHTYIHTLSTVRQLRKKEEEEWSHAAQTLREMYLLIMLIRDETFILFNVLVS